MKYTLLELTQDVLSSMDSEEINSISDTTESQQVVKIIKTVYDDIISRAGIELHKTPFNLIASADNTKPVLMYKPDNISNIEWLQYDKRMDGETAPNWGPVHYLPFEDFMRLTNGSNLDDDNVFAMTFTASGFTTTFMYRNDVAPTYYTSFDDHTMVFDAYDSDIDDTLQSNKTLGYGQRNLVFVESDTFVPELQADQFALLLNEAKSLAWAELKQTTHAKAENTAKRNWLHLARTRQHIPVPAFNNYAHPRLDSPNYGRK